jgi:cytochrome c biogenesis protein CcmG, thiol:disulfide interchange protein DsbE
MMLYFALQSDWTDACMLTLRGLIFATLAVAVTVGAPAVAGDEPLDLELLKGKVVYLDFWASWCAPCRESFPWMNRMQSDLASNGLVIVAVNVDNERAAAEQFLRGHPAQFRIVYDPEGKLPEKFGVRVMPTSFLIDRNGRIQLQHRGFFLKDRDALAQQVRALVLAR